MLIADLRQTILLQCFLMILPSEFVCYLSGGGIVTYKEEIEKSIDLKIYENENLFASKEKFSDISGKSPAMSAIHSFFRSALSFDTHWFIVISWILFLWSIFVPDVAGLGVETRTNIRMLKMGCFWSFVGGCMKKESRDSTCLRVINQLKVWIYRLKRKF